MFKKGVSDSGTPFLCLPVMEKYVPLQPNWKHNGKNRIDL